MAPKIIILVPISLTIPGSLLASHTVETKPNIIIIFADDHGYGDLGCYGTTQFITPNIDKMAAEGISSPISLSQARYVAPQGPDC